MTHLNIGVVILKLSPILQGPLYLDYPVRVKVPEDSGKHPCIILMVFFHLLMEHLCSNTGYKLEHYLIFFFIKRNWKPWKISEISCLAMLL